MNPFKGYDWHELIEYWDIKVESKYEYPEWTGKQDVYMSDFIDPETRRVDLDAYFDAHGEGYREYLKELGRIEQLKEQEEVDAIKEYLNASIRNKTEKKVAEELRQFISALANESKKIDYFYPVWEALLKVEDDYTLFQLVAHLLPLMWT
jgi:hypothetical protein